MATPRILMRTIIFGVVSLTIVLASIGRWIVSGCPVGFSCGSCQSASGGRTILGSSYNLLTNISMTADKTVAVLDLAGRHVVVRGNELAVDGTARNSIPPGCKQLEFTASGTLLRVSADGKIIQEID
jgi:hypothetical protein